MRKSLLRKFRSIAPVVFLILTIASCSSTKNIKYFQDIPDSSAASNVKISAVPYSPPVIQPDDILTINVITLDPTASMAINLGNIPNAVTTASGMPGSNGTALNITGYLVNGNGFIEMPIVGQIKVSGLTTSQAKDTITNRVQKYYKDASVIVRFANFKITVAGEVNRPSVYIIPNEKVTLMDALGMAGDLTIFGKRDNVLLVRTLEDGTRETHRFNLTKSKSLTSPYFYLKQNDYVYVEPNKGKAAATDASQARTYAILGSVLSVLIVLASRL